jgi:hypothetical protein
VIIVRDAFSLNPAVAVNKKTSALRQHERYWVHWKAEKQQVAQKISGVLRKSDCNGVQPAAGWLNVKLA